MIIYIYNFIKLQELFISLKYNIDMNEINFEFLTIKPIARIKNDFPTKFGLPRQGDLIKNTKGKIIFEKEYRKEGILRGLEDFSHIWIIWGFSSFNQQKEFSPTIRPPKLGGNKRVGVFASRSPNRPNPIGISAVKIESITFDKEEGPIIYVSGMDLMNNTPIYDIKPYIPYCDSIIDAKEGYTKETRSKHELKINFPSDLKTKLAKERAEEIIDILKQDPRPGFQHDSNKIYGFRYASFEIKFHVENDEELFIDDILFLS